MTKYQKMSGLLLFITIMSSISLSSACTPMEIKALLQFKETLFDTAPELESWTANTTNDCCNWHGVVCITRTRTNRVFELHLPSLPPSPYGATINESFVLLQELRLLDLSNNTFHGAIPSFFGSLENLEHLDLSQSGFEGTIPHELENLSKLKYLNLSGLYTFSGSLDWLSGLSMLEVLDMSQLNLSQSFDWFESVNKLPSLVELHFSSCELPPILPRAKVDSRPSLLVLNLAKNEFRGSIPDQLRSFSLLKVLDLSKNLLTSSLPKWLYDFQHLEILNLRKNLLEARISSAIENLTSLSTLDLSSNIELKGGIPKSIGKLCKLKSLSFSRTKLGQGVNEILDILSGCSSNVLESLHLNDCALSGRLSDQVTNFKNLTMLRLSNNLISGTIPLVSSAEMMSLRSLLLDNNKLEGTLPLWIGRLSQLERLNVSYNLLEGKVFEMHFVDHKNLKAFDGSMNELKLEVGSGWIPPFHSLEVLRLRNWDVGAKFPSWIHSLQKLHVLDLSSSTISSSIPAWVWNSSLKFSNLNLSHNHILGAIPDIQNISHPFSEIDLSHNRLEGPLPVISPDVKVFDASNNFFSGSISKFLCYGMDELEDKKTEILNLDNNLLTGEIPNCWEIWDNLMLVRLSSNNMSGNIPELMGSMMGLMYLHLRNNSLSGELPKLEGPLITLDLGENQLTGRIPTWLGLGMDYLSIFSIRGNKFYGEIPTSLCTLESLQILDLAHNNLSGIIPDCFKRFKYMSQTDIEAPEFYYYLEEGHVQWDESLILMKGRIVEYDRTLKYVKLMDLSSNNLSGPIPKELTQLKALQSLNLSNNILSGNIPEDIGFMEGIEALDLSRNRLSGRIPQSMAKLTFLSMLNVSYNNLSGTIPSSTQLQSLPNSSFIGNKGLLGPPLVENSTTNGNGSVLFNPRDEGQTKYKDGGVNWGLYVSVAVGFIVGFWSVLSPLMLNRRWRHVYYLFLDRLWFRIRRTLK